MRVPQCSHHKDSSGALHSHPCVTSPMIAAIAQSRCQPNHAYLWRPISGVTYTRSVIHCGDRLPGKSLKDPLNQALSPELDPEQYTKYHTLLLHWQHNWTSFCPAKSPAGTECIQYRWSMISPSFFTLLLPEYLITAIVSLGQLYALNIDVLFINTLNISGIYSWLLSTWLPICAVFQTDSNVAFG